MELSDSGEILQEAHFALMSGKSVYEDELHRRLHFLAEAGDEAAKAFFVTALHNEAADWRLEAVRNLGFHYDLKPEVRIVAEIRHLLVSDPDDDVRLAAAAVLGIRSLWPDQDLYRAMTDDHNDIVRRVAFESLLMLAGKGYNEVQRIMQQIEVGQLKVSAATLETLIGEKFSDLVKNHN